jgi:hypothetical protein
MSIGHGGAAGEEAAATGEFYILRALHDEAQFVFHIEHANFAECCGIKENQG